MLPQLMGRTSPAVTVCTDALEQCASAIPVVDRVRDDEDQLLMQGCNRMVTRSGSRHMLGSLTSFVLQYIVCFTPAVICHCSYICTNFLVSVNILDLDTLHSRARETLTSASRRQAKYCFERDRFKALQVRCAHGRGCRTHSCLLSAGELS